MGAVFKKQTTRPLPAGAEIFTRKGERFARWKVKGKTRTAPLTTGEDGRDRIVTESPFYVAKYRDGAGVVCVESTGCRDETAARQVLATLERRAELVRSNVMTAAEVAIGDHQARALAKHLAAFDEHHQAKGVTKIHREDTGRYLRRLAADCSFGTLADLRREALERWLALRTADGMSARTRNAYRNALVSFCNWCVETSRLALNPFDPVSKANERADPRRQRRAMTESELVKLLAVARERPLLEAQTVRKGPRKGERYADVRPEVRDRLDRLGRERALIYKTLVLSGLRKGELASLTVAHLHLDDPVPFASLDAADEKNREGNGIALRDDLAADLRDWLADKLLRLQAEALKAGDPTAGPIAARYASLRRAGPAGEDPRPRPCCRRDRPPGESEWQVDHRQARRPRPKPRRSRPANDVRNADEQGRGFPADRTSRDASQRHPADDGRLHRPEVARRSGSPRRPADPFPSRRRVNEGSYPGDGNGGKGGELGCTIGCTNCVTIGGNRGQFLSWRSRVAFRTNSA